MYSLIGLLIGAGLSYLVMDYDNSFTDRVSHIDKFIIWCVIYLPVGGVLGWLIGSVIDKIVEKK